MSKKIFSVINQKGGVGKTTTTVNLGTAMAACDAKVLLIDMDLRETYLLVLEYHQQIEVLVFMISYLQEKIE